MNNSLKFERYIEDFINLHRLFEKKYRYLLAWSGGLDSTVLFHLLLKMKDFQFEVIHFNHGIRAEAYKEENEIVRLCQQYQIHCHVFHLNLNKHQSNFEFVARNNRKGLYQKFITDGYKIIEAHHLDDSFEWSLIQKFKQGSLDQTLGIPIHSKNIVRPLMCVSKAQLKQYAIDHQITWSEDSTNLENNFLRNYVRNVIVPKIKSRFPQYLKHYVYQMNEQALRLKVHRLYKLKNDYPLVKVNHFVAGLVFQSKYLELYRQELIQTILSLSTAKRGKINVVLDQIFATQKSIRNDVRYKKFNGPYKFAGNVSAYLFCDRLWIVGDLGLKQFEAVDLQSTNTQIPFGLTNQNSLEYFPNLILISNKDKNSRIEIPFLKNTINILKTSHIPYSFVSLMSK